MKDKTYAIGLYEKAVPNELTWKAKLSAAKEAGYDFVEMSIDESDEKLARLDMSMDKRLELVQTMFEAGIPIRSICLSGHRKYPMGSSASEIREKSMEIMEKAIKLADDLGVRIIMLAGYDVYYEASTKETKKRFADNLKAAVHMAARNGVQLAFETMETEFMNTVRKSMKYVEEIGSPYLNVYPDSGNITNAAVTYKEDVLKDLNTGEKHLAALHLKETRPGEFRDLMYGEGHVDFESMIHTAWNMGVRRYVTEFWYLGSEDWKKDLKFAYDSMTKYLEKEEQAECWSN